MNEATVVNLFFTFRVFLVGGIMLALPHIGRRGLVFGTYLGEEQVKGAEVAKLRRSWDVGTAAVIAVSLLVGWTISLTGEPIHGNLTGTAVLLLSGFALYLWIHGKARRLAPPVAAGQALRASALLDVDETPGVGFAKFALAACVIVALGSAAHATLSFEAMPDRIPTLANIFGRGNEPTEKSIVTFLLFPSFNLVFSTFFALLGLLVAEAKRSLRGGSGGRSAEAQIAFRTAMAHIFSGIGLCYCLILTVTSLEINRVASGQTQSLGMSILWALLATLVYMLVSLIRVFRSLGQGGALLETGSVEAPLAGGLADDAKWILGLMYFDRDDPSLMVESRFIGYGFNWGNRYSWVIVATFLTACLGLTGLILMELGLIS